MKKSILLTALVILLPLFFTYGSPIGIRFNSSIDSLKWELNRKIGNFIERKKLEAKTEYELTLIKEKFYLDRVVIDGKVFSIGIYKLDENSGYIAICGDDIAVIDGNGDGQPDGIMYLKNPPKPQDFFLQDQIKELKFVLDEKVLSTTLVFENDVMDIIIEKKTTGDVSKLKVEDYAFSSKKILELVLSLYESFEQ